MDQRLAGVTAGVVGLSLTVVGLLEYVVAGYPALPFDPFATGVLVAIGGLLLLVTGGVAVVTATDTLSLRTGTAVGVVTLSIAVFQPDALLFGGVFWLGLVSMVFIAAAAYLTVTNAH